MAGGPEEILHGRAESAESGPGPHTSRSHVVAGGVEERVEGGHEPFGGHVGSEITAVPAPVDELAKPPVRSLVRASQRLGREQLARGLRDGVVAVQIAPAHLDDALKCLKRWPSLGFDRVECARRPPHGPLHDSLQELLARSEVCVHGYARDARLVRDGDNGRPHPAFEQPLGAVEDGLDVALGGRSPVIGSRL